MTTAMTTSERSASRALARAALYRLLSQALTFPARGAVEELHQLDVPHARQLASQLAPALARALDAFAAEAERATAEALQVEHRRVFSHVTTIDCPSYETVYTTQQIFQETHELSDLSGFYRAFGLVLAERERPDHISVQLEFMQLLAFKEAYARAYHSPGKTRICRDAQRAFLRDHLGRWVPRFAELLARKAERGFYRALAELLKAFVAAEVARLRVRPDVPVLSADRLERKPEDDEICPFSTECDVQMRGADRVPAQPP